MKRHQSNPLIIPSDISSSQVDLKVVGVFNAAAIEHEGKTFLFLRVAEEPVIREADTVVGVYYDINEQSVKTISFNKHDPEIDNSDPRVIRTRKGVLLTSVSHLRKAVSVDGCTFTVDKEPLFLPETKYETYGIEDPRITCIDNTFYLNYTGVSRHGITTMLAQSKDLNTFTRVGVMFPPDNRDVTIFPERCDGLYRALHRPCGAEFGAPSIWCTSSNDLMHWGGHVSILESSDALWEAKKIGGGAVPIKTERGWLVIYHGVSYDDSYSLGAVLLDLDDPSKVVARLKEPLLVAETEYEKNGFFANVVFTCGAILRKDKTIDIYYGASDEALCVASVELEELLNRF